MKRTTTEVIEDHLHKRLQGDVEGDIAANFDDKVVILSHYDTFYGHDGVRQSADKLDEDVPKAEFTYKLIKIEADYALLEWTASSPQGKVCDGVDTFVVRDGKVIMQSIYYRVHGE